MRHGVERAGNIQEDGSSVVTPLKATLQAISKIDQCSEAAPLSLETVLVWKEIATLRIPLLKPVKNNPLKDFPQRGEQSDDPKIFRVAGCFRFSATLGQ